MSGERVTVYEVVNPDHAGERGLFYPTLTAAMVNAGPRLEVWQLADDEAQTRMLRCWPDAEPAADTAPAGVQPASLSDIALSRANRVAVELLAEYPVAGYEQTVTLLALAYSHGERSGLAQGLGLAERILIDALTDRR